MSANSKFAEMKEGENHAEESVRTCDTDCGKWRNNEEKCCAFV